MKKITIALLFLVGCWQDLPDPYWHDGQKITATVQTDISDDSAQAYKDRVRADAELWNHGLEALGCPAPFDYVDEAIDNTGLIILSADEKAAGEWYGATYDSPSVIYIRPDGDGTLDQWIVQPTWNVVEHELGHALGLEHNMNPDSIMCVRGTGAGVDCYSGYKDKSITKPLVPTCDLRAAAAALGCGP